MHCRVIRMLLFHTLLATKARKAAIQVYLLPSDKIRCTNKTTQKAQHSYNPSYPFHALFLRRQPDRRRPSSNFARILPILQHAHPNARVILRRNSGPFGDDRTDKLLPPLWFISEVPAVVPVVALYRGYLQFDLLCVFRLFCAVFTRNKTVINCIPTTIQDALSHLPAIFKLKMT